MRDAIEVEATRGSVLRTSALAKAAPAARVRGLHGLLDLRAEVVAGRTRLTAVRQRPPLQVLRALHLDSAVPDLATVTIASPSGGILQGDRLETRIEVTPRARLRVGTQSATRIYRCPEDPARIRTELIVRPGGYLEFLPDAYLPYAASRLEASMTCHVALGATLILGEVVTGGRLALGEAFDMDRFESVIELRRLDDELLARDTLRLEASEPAARLGRLGRHLAVGTLFVVHEGFAADTLREALAAAGPATYAGVSDLPNRAGAWLRVLAPDGRAASAVVAAGWAAARRAILGYAPVPDRRP
jgi:urease accessory protein